MEEKTKYYAFISYNSADEKWAKWLQHNLEYYHVPSALCKEYSNLPKKIRPVFWYKQDLSGTKLKEALSKELENSKFLIVICSPDSAKSPWVNDEIESFIKQGKGDKIIPFIVEGKPHANNPDEECFPPALLGLKRDEEIRGIDVRRKEGKFHALVDVIATMFGIRFDELWGRHKKRRRRIVVSYFVIISVIISMFMAWRISVKKEQITQARFIAAEAEKLAERGDRYMCIKLLNYAGRNNKESLKNADFEHAMRSIDCNYKFPERRFVHDYNVYSFAFSPDGKYVVTASGDSTSKIWSVETGDCLQTLNHRRSVESVEFSPDGRYVVTASRDNTSKIWLVRTGECLQTLNHEGSVYSAVFSTNGRYVVTASRDNTSKIWLVRTGECLQTLNHEERVSSAKFSPDGKYVVTCCANVAYLWSMQSFDKMSRLDEMVNVVFSPDEEYILAYDDIGRAKLWDIEHGGYLTNINNELKIYSEFSSDGKYIVTSSYGRTAKVWLVENDSCISIINNGGGGC